MRTILARAAVVATALLVVLPMAASAAVDDYAAEANTSAVNISVFEEAVGSPLLDLVSTDAFAAADPVASASIQPIQVLGEDLIPLREADSEGDPVRDPEDEADDCALPVDTTGLTLSAVCASASADAGASDEASANATADLLEVAVDGSFVAGVLTSSLEDLLTSEAFQDVVDQEPVQAAVDQFIAECNEILAEIDDETQITATADELFDMSPEELDAVKDPVEEAVEEADEDGYCTAVFTLTVDDLDPITGIDLTPITDALADVDLITLAIDGASSDIAGTDADMSAAAEQVFVTLSGPALTDVLDEAIRQVVADIVAGIADRIGDLVGEDLLDEETEEFQQALDDSLAAALDAIPLFGITDPLLTAVVSGGTANATLDNDAASTTAGGDEPFVTVSLAGGIMELFGQDPESGTFELSGGESQTIAEDTPLESTISVGTLTTEDGVTFEDTDLVGSTATASVTDVALLQGEDFQGGITIVLAESLAGVYSADEPVAASDPTPDLPNTGGGAALAAVLALGAAVALRRRND